MLRSGHTKQVSCSRMDRARRLGQVVVAKEAVEKSKAHVTDANKAFSVGLVSRADVLRLEAQVAAAQQLQAEADAFAAVAEEVDETTVGSAAGLPAAEIRGSRAWTGAGTPALIAWGLVTPGARATAATD